MRSKALLGMFGAACLAGVVVAAGCKTTSSEGNMGGGSMSADGGMTSADGGMSGMAHDMGSGASAAANDVKQGATSAGQTMADAGEAAYGAARDTASGAAQGASDAASNAATTASDAARSAAGASDGGMSAGSSTTSGTTSDTSSSGSSAGSASATPTDAQIAQIVMTADKGEIDAAKVAAKNSKNAKVKAFARQMIKDHGNVDKQLKKLATSASISPEESDTSRSLQQQAEQALSSIKDLQGKEFDKAYLDGQVQMHQQVLNSLDQQLIPNAQNSQLKDLLTKVRGHVQHHLQQAQTLQSSVGGGTSGGQ